VTQNGGLSDGSGVGTIFSLATNGVFKRSILLPICLVAATLTEPIRWQA